MENKKYVKRTQAQKLSWLINLFAEIFRITSVNSQQNILKKLEKDDKKMHLLVLTGCRENM